MTLIFRNFGQEIFQIYEEFLVIPLLLEWALKERNFGQEISQIYEFFIIPRLLEWAWKVIW